MTIVSLVHHPVACIICWQGESTIRARGQLTLVRSLTERWGLYFGKEHYKSGDQREKRSAMRTKGYERMKETFMEQKMAQRITNILKRVLHL